MIKPINISPLNTTMEVYIDCVYCGSKGVVKHNLINIDNKYELQQLNEEPCPDCGINLTKVGIPKLSAKDIDRLSRKLFKNSESFPTNFYIHLLFDENSGHSESALFSERIKSLLQFVGKSNLNRDRTVIGNIFSAVLQYFKSEGYIDDGLFDNEYQKCLEMWGSFFKNN